MGEYSFWRDLMLAFVVSAARGYGWCLVRSRVARTGTLYLWLRRGGRELRLRISDHRRSYTQHGCHWSATPNTPHWWRSLAFVLRHGRRAPLALSLPGHD